MALRGEEFYPLSYHEKKKVWKVHVFKNVDEAIPVWEVYYEKVGFPMLFAFGLDARVCEHYEVMDIAWNNIDKYKRWFK